MDRKLRVAQRLVAVLSVLLIAAISFGLVQYALLMQLRYEVSEGNKTSCDDGYVAKIVDGSKVTCVMLRVGPGMVTHRVLAGGKEGGFKRVFSSTKKERRNETRLRHSVSFRIGKLGDGWVR